MAGHVDNEGQWKSADACSEGHYIIFLKVLVKRQRGSVRS